MGGVGGNAEKNPVTLDFTSTGPGEFPATSRNFRQEAAQAPWILPTMPSTRESLMHLNQMDRT